MIKNEICCLIITYNPNDVFFDLIKVIQSQVQEIIIVDNNSEQNIKTKLNNLSNLTKIIYLQNQKNYGIAKALNQGIDYAIQKKFKWVITFDQDSKPFNNIIDILSEVYERYPSKQKIGAIGSNALKTNSEKYYSVSTNKKYVEKDYLITSGSIISTKIFSEIGGFREDFFIDNVDIEYSLRLKKNGKISLISNKPGMFHDAGNPITKGYGIFKTTSTNHNNSRRYYMAKNHIIVSKEYFLRFPYFIAKLNYFFILSLIKILFIETDKKQKIINIIRGIKDGIFYSSKTKKLPVLTL